MTIYEKLSLIQQEFKSKKSRYNSFGKYNFRSAEDILEALKPFNKKYKVFFKVNEKYLDNGVIETTAFMYDFENSEPITATAVAGVDFNQKGMQVPQQFGSASSYGKKYALGNLLLIDDTADADATNTHGKQSKPKLTQEQFLATMKGTKEKAQNVLMRFNVNDKHKEQIIQKFKI